MAYREFVDSAGTTWRVWSTAPLRGAHLDGGYENGWLTFERIENGGDSGTTSSPYVRRLTPIPRDWETAPDQRLELMCRAAEEVRRRISQPLARPSLERPLGDDFSQQR